MKKIILILISAAFCFAAVDVGAIVHTDENSSTVLTNKNVFGAHLFNGNFANAKQHIYNPNYRINVGDVVLLKMWGAFELEQSLVVDSQGNIFVPKVGVIKLLGVRNGDIVSIITQHVKNIFKDNVFVYADMQTYQNVSVFVTGNVNKPGLYEGLSSDSLIQYLDKASGINQQYGSFRRIKILRNNELYRQIDLYDFLIDGKMELISFKSGDVILVESIGAYISAKGDVLREFRFESRREFMNLQELAKLAGIKPTTTNAIVKSYKKNNRLNINSYSEEEFGNVFLRAGDEVEFLPDHLANEIKINVEGEHDGLHTIILKKGSTLQDLKDKIATNPQSNMEAIQIFRKSVAAVQKNLLDAQLRELETLTLTTPSVSPEEANMRAQEIKAILEFIERAKKIEPKGQITINEKTAAQSIILEDEDTINIPTMNNIIIVQGEVGVPGAFTYIKKQDINEYISLAGGFSQRANKNRVLIIRASGKAENYDASLFSFGKPKMQAGDSILVLPRAEGKTLQFTNLITQILYNVAIATKVILDI
ncbi:MAG: polysaccharide biosynthesis/export family protein [Campylobacteraceae bacterium]|jgi:protein involved in polysaccharide export with SLBB domain|nr:polysaccharide biosynthesis/export family protein [Campylobacteraceae bacterium]